jgi:large subunit ribosomal protein L25
MAQDTPTIVGEPRERLGTRYAQRIRQNGRLPAVVYGHGEEPVHITVDEKEMLNSLHDGSRVYSISAGKSDAQTCLVKALQFGYLGDNVIHIDFARVSLDDEVTVMVAVTLNGESAGAKQPGATLQVIRTEIEVTCKVSDIPNEIAFDLSQMGESVLVGDLTMPAGVVATLDAEKPIAIISFVKEEEEGAGEEAAVDVDGAGPEVITERAEDADATSDGDKKKNE